MSKGLYYPEINDARHGKLNGLDVKEEQKSANNDYFSFSKYESILHSNFCSIFFCQRKGMDCTGSNLLP